MPSIKDLRNLLDAPPPPPPPMTGLGDAVARVTKKLGIHTCTPCARRQELLNKLVPFKK